MKSLFALVFLAMAATCSHAAEPASAPSTAPATAPTTAPATQPTEYDFNIHPAALPEPALKYRLAPSFFDQTPGDSSSLYSATEYGLASVKSETSDEWFDLIDQPMDKFQVDRAKKVLDDYYSSSRRTRLDIAARREHCHWDVALREQGVYALLPHLNWVRKAEVLVSLSVKVAIAEGRYDDAIHDLETGIGMLIHFKEESCTVQALVATSCMKFMLDRINDLQQAPGAPNLYWSMQNMPAIVDLQVTAEIERDFLSASVHMSLNDPKTVDPSAFSDSLAEMDRWTMPESSDFDSVAKAKLQVTMQFAKATPSAIAWLKSHGYTDKQIEALPPGQAVVIYFLESYQVAMDENVKWVSLPYWQARTVSALAAKRLSDPQSPFAANPLIRDFGLTGRLRSTTAISEMRRRLAMMEIVDGLRAYAAAHEGKLPASLDDLVETPAPIDPMTGKAFEYQVDGATATLRSVAETDKGPSPMTFHIHLSDLKK